MKKPPPLPDLDDDAEFRRRLTPLMQTVLPEDRKSAGPGDRQSVVPERRISGIPDSRNSPLVEAAAEQARIEAVRGEKRRFEYMMPERVGRALAEDAAGRGMSATTRLLEVLRDAGYPVIREDLIDLRKMPKR